MANAKIQKEITVKRISAFKFEIEVSAEMSKMEVRTVEPVKTETLNNGNDFVQSGIQNRISVIKRAPPSVAHIRDVEKRVKCEGDGGKVMCTCRKKQENSNIVPARAILIQDAILYRIIEILLWKLLGEEYLTYWGYPKTPTYRLLWKIVHYYSCFQPGKMTTLVQEHDCQGDITCFMEHVGHFLDLCAPTQEIKQRFGWSRLSREEILKKIYYEDLLPFLKKSDLTNYANILDSHKDILRLQKWQEQGFTAISWNGHEHFSRLKSRFPWCPQCCRRLRKSVISYYRP